MGEYKNAILIGDCIDRLRELPDGFVNTCVTSPPYWGLRDYGVDGQIGLEETPDAYVERMVAVFREVKRVLRDDGTLWLNLGDSYASSGSGRQGTKGQRADRRFTADTAGGLSHGLKAKDLVGIPWRVAFALQADGWYLRSDIIWHKPNAMPESVRDRPTKAHEYIFLLTKSDRYYYDHESVREAIQSDRSPSRKAKRTGTGRKELRPTGKPYDGTGDTRSRRTVWSVPTRPFKGAHFATFPPELIEPCVLAGCPEGGIVLDPFFGAGTTGVVSKEFVRNYVGIELNADYAQIAQERLEGERA